MIEPRNQGQVDLTIIGNNRTKKSWFIICLIVDSQHYSFALRISFSVGDLRTAYACDLRMVTAATKTSLFTEINEKKTQKLGWLIRYDCLIINQESKPGLCDYDWK